MTTAAGEAWKNVAGYAAAVVVSVVAATVGLQLSRADLRIPFFYSGDNLMGQMFVQNVLDTGWVFDDGRLGSGAMDSRLSDPGCPPCRRRQAARGRLSELRRRPQPLLPDDVPSDGPVRLFRLAPAARRAPRCTRRCCPLRLHDVPFLSPHGTSLSIRLLSRSSDALDRPADVGRNPFLRRWEAAGAALLCVLTGLAGVYYAFFSCFLLLAAGAAAAFRERCWTTLAAAVLPALLIAASVAAALAPSLLHTARYGPNLETGRRSAAEADSYGLSVSALLLPVVQHRIGFSPIVPTDSCRRRASRPARPRHPRSAASPRSASSG